MRDLPLPVTPDRWIVQIFSAKSVAEGGIVRRKVRDVERLIGRRRFLYEAERRGFHVAENAGQFVIFCNQEPVRLLV
ncbi:N-(5'-phosphoribosyl)anthranilate isomerase [Paragemmobacter straminiformis]|uniref:N-(5'-phosphoribosyl)anthranilate isomerase n=1 Tax=Paragemmobacter straminiformis TaxID=2045119 RepID=A0A842IBT1_9RHOB|nr:N-(5'-phosphoribosyl)anthranilate isomerase [Gemmobacter straminiformis]MBC2837036.1 N-(5'-phosphoribosyl)anthranilate isomerase [Gemmobacter straminiformis]